MDSRSQVLRALEDERWDWRTVEGIAQEARLSQEEVLEILEGSPGEVIRSRVSDAKGRALYTSRQRYAKRHDFWGKFRSS